MDQSYLSREAELSEIEFQLRQRQVRTLKTSVEKDVAERRQLLQQLVALERENAALRIRHRRRRHRPESTCASIAKAESGEGTAARRRRLIGETEDFVATVNAQLRDDLRLVLRVRSGITLDISELSRAEKVEALWLLRGDPHVEALEKFPNACPLSLQRDLQEVAEDWQALYPLPRNTIIDEVTDQLFANVGTVRRVEATTERTNAEYLQKAAENMGFCEPPPLQLAPEAEDEEEEAGDVLAKPAYMFDAPNQPTTIVLRADPTGRERGLQVRWATLDKLVERMTLDQGTDLNTRYVFLLTYPSFTTAHVVLDKLAARYAVPVPPNMTPEEIQFFKKQRRDGIQIRVCSVLKYWLDEHYEDFAEDEYLLQRLTEFVENMLLDHSSQLSRPYALRLRALMKKKARSSEGKNVISVDRCPKPLFHSKSITPERFDMLSCNPLELARQITLLDFDLFACIRPRECLNQGWTKKDKMSRAPNIVALSRQFEMVSGLVISVVLTFDTPAQRAKYFHQFVEIMKRCRELNNFSSTFAIYCGLSSNAIYRLKATKELVPRKSLEALDEIKELFRGDKSFKNLRTALARSLTPCIPHLGLFLTDLVYIEDGNQDNMHGMINFDKRCKLAERIRWIKQFQQESYQLEPVPVIQAWLRANFVHVDGKTMWEKSREIEPPVKRNPS